MTFKKNYWKKRNKAREAASNERLHSSNTNRLGNYKQTSEQEKKQASNQQASKVSSTVDHGPGTPDPQA